MIFLPKMGSISRCIEMRNKSFQELTEVEAQKVLEEFFEDGVANIDIVIAHAANAGVKCDYRIDSLSSFLQWALSEMHAIPTEPDISVPEWIRSTSNYEKDLFDFDDRSKDLICIAGYYFGECFVRNASSLRWATGNIEFAEANMPVVTGFQHEHELAPAWVLENIFRRITRDPERKKDIETMIDKWCSFIGD